MKYIGSKRRLKKYILPILQKTIDDNNITTYIEPFGGGANVIDSIKCKNLFYYDIHPQLVALLQHIQETTDDLPQTITKEEYEAVKKNPEKYPSWYVGLVGFCASFGAGYFNGYAKPYHDSKNYDIIRDYANEGIRNLIKQAPSLKNINFQCADFREIKIPNNSLIYCDPPYKGTRKYKGLTNFPYDEYYDWCRNVAKNNIIYMSEATMPEDFKIVWEKELRQQLNYSGDNCRNYRPERLYTL